MEGDSITEDSAQAHLGIDLNCGQFSFAELPKTYKCVVGVTGTLKELLQVDGIRKVIREEYQISRYTFMPSIFGERRLVFREGEHVMLTANREDWLRRIEQVLKAFQQQGKSVLVFWKNEEMFRLFPSWQTTDHVTERIAPQRRQQFILAAGAAGKVTHFTRSFGRGIDFSMPSGHELILVQTFLSSLVSEQTQIQGRTARQGKEGQYRLVLCKDDLVSKFGFSEEDVSNLESGSAEVVKTLLLGKQAEKMQKKAITMLERKGKAEVVETKTRQFQEMRDKKDILFRLAELNTSFGEVHYTLMLDTSGSMGGTRKNSPWMQLVECFNMFITMLSKDAFQASCTKVSLVFFDPMSKLLTPDHAAVKNVQDIAHHYTGGGTNFAAAMRECAFVLNKSQTDAQEILVFLTDGGASVPAHEIDTLLASHKTCIKKMICIGFGSNANMDQLRQICDKFTEQGVDASMTNPTDLSSLKVCFEQAAQSQAVHLAR